MKYLAVDGEFRFAGDHGEVQDDMIEALSDGEGPEMAILR